MRSFASVSFRLLGPFISPDSRARRETVRALRAARISTFPEWYTAQSYMAATIGALVMGLAGAILVWLLDPPVLTATLRTVLVGGLAVTTFFGVRLTFLLYPRVRATARAKEIDAEYQSVVVLCYALARGGMPALDIFRVIAKEKDTYGEISGEFAMVIRDVELFGNDLITALQNGTATTPSGAMKGFFEGLVTILNSGAEPRDYFKRQADMQLLRAETETESVLQRAGMLAEVYVSSFLVLPLLLLVVLSGLSSLGNGQEAYIPLVVYGLIPAGTLAYLITLEVLMPQTEIKPTPPVRHALSDFGMASLPSDAERLPPPWKVKDPLVRGGSIQSRTNLYWRVRSVVRRTRDHASSVWKQKKEHLVTRPMDAIEISGPLALVLFGAGAVWLYLQQADRVTLLLHGAALLFATSVLAFALPAIFHEVRVLRARRVEAALPEMLSKLAGFNERGIGLLQSFQILGRSTSGALSKELRSVERDVQVNGNLQSAIKRLRERVKTMRMTKLGILLERASSSTGNMKEVLDIAAQDETRAETLRARKRASMMSYVLVIYFVFGVFLYVTTMVTSLFYGDSSFAVSIGTQGSSTRIGQGLAAAEARVLFLHAVVLQGAACGLIAGRLGEGHTLSGVKHAAILGGLAWLVFLVWVV